MFKRTNRLMRRVLVCAGNERAKIGTVPRASGNHLPNVLTNVETQLHGFIYFACGHLYHR